MDCPRCSATVPSSEVRCPSCDRRVSISGGELLLGALGLLAGGYVVSKVAKKSLNFLSGLDWDSIGEELKKAIELANIDMAKLEGNTTRLNRAETLLKSSTYDKMAIDQAAFLTCATLESGLKVLAERHHIELDPDNKGMMELTVKLNENGIVSQDEYRQIKRLILDVRNPVFHGSFGVHDREAIQGYIDFCREFMLEHNLRKKYEW